jgi:hypothetical protein
MTARRALCVLLIAASARAQDGGLGEFKFEPKPAQAPEAAGKPVDAPQAPKKRTAGDADATIAFVGDTGTGYAALAVFQLIKKKGADLIVHLGDIGYESTAKEVHTKVVDHKDVLAGAVPMIFVMGNHDYEHKQKSEYQKYAGTWAPSVGCSGYGADFWGRKMSCPFNGVQIVGVIPHMRGKGEDSGAEADAKYADYIRDEMKKSDAAWKICAWHKPGAYLTAGDNGDGPKEMVVQNACLEAGALIMTGHEHGYSRTGLITQFSSDAAGKKIAVKTDPSRKKCDPMTIEPGKTFAVVSGAGGRKLRQTRSSMWKYMEAVFMFNMKKGCGGGSGGDADDGEEITEGEDDADDGKDAASEHPKQEAIDKAAKAGKAGALICKFKGASASCTFWTTDGKAFDSFDLVSKL